MSESDVILVRVPKELKEKMRRYGIDWSKEISKFLEERIRALELLEVLNSIEEKAKNRRTRVNSTKIIREAREEH